MKFSILALALLLAAGCASSPGPDKTLYAVSHKPPDYVVVSISNTGAAQPNPAYLDIDYTKDQTLYFTTVGTNLNVIFTDRGQPFKVICTGSICTAKIDKPHKNLYPYKYSIDFTNTSGDPVHVDPIVIIDEVETWVDY